MAQQARSRSSLRTLGVLLFAVAAVYVALYPRLKRMSEEAARINRDVDRRPTQSAGPSDLEQLHSRVEFEPNNPDLRMEFASKLRDAGRLSEAEDQAQAAVRLRSDRPEPLLLLGDVRHRAKELDLAIATYRTTLARFPKQAEAAAALGWIYISLGWTQEARELLDQALASNPTDPHLKVALALTCLQASELGRAETILKEIRRARPQDVDLWSPLVDVYLKGKRPDDAVQVARETLALKPDDVRLLSGLGQAQYDTGDAAAAAATFQHILNLDKTNLEAHVHLAMCYRAMNNPQDAIRELEYVYRQAPDFEQTRQILGQLYSQNGRSDEGKRLLQEAAQRRAAADLQAQAGYLLLHKPRSPKAHYRMALSYQQQRDEPRMIVELTRTVELDPNDSDAARLLTAALQRRSAHGGG